MATVSTKSVINDIIAGEYPEDRTRFIVQYTTVEGQTVYGVTFHEDFITERGFRYLLPSQYIHNPKVYWRDIEWFKKQLPQYLAFIKMFPVAEDSPQKEL